MLPRAVRPIACPLYISHGSNTFSKAMVDNCSSKALELRSMSNDLQMSLRVNFPAYVDGICSTYGNCVGKPNESAIIFPLECCAAAEIVLFTMRIV